MQCSSMTYGLLLSDASLERVQSLIAKAALLKVDQQRLTGVQQACVNRDKSAVLVLQAALQAEPFSMDVFRLRLLDARRLGLKSEAHSAQGNARCVMQCQMLAQAPLQHDWHLAFRIHEMLVSTAHHMMMLLCHMRRPWMLICHMVWYSARQQLRESNVHSKLQSQQHDHLGLAPWQCRGAPRQCSCCKITSCKPCVAFSVTVFPSRHV